MDFNNTSKRQHLSCVLPDDISDDQWNFYRNFSWWLEGACSLFIGTTGITLNLVSIFVFCGSKLAASLFNWLLVCLAIFDIFFLLNGILEAVRNYFIPTAFHDYMFVNFLFPFRSIVMCCSIFTTVIIAYERYNAFKRPLSIRKNSLRGLQTLHTHFLCNWRRVIKYVGPIIIFATLFYIPKWFELQLQKKKDGINVMNGISDDYSIVLTELRKNTQYSLWYLNVSNLLITALLPVFTFAYLNINIYLEFKKYLKRLPSLSGLGKADRNIQRRIRKQEKELVNHTMVLFAIVVLLGFCHVLRIVLNIEELKSIYDERHAKEMGCEWIRFWTIFASNISSLLLQINSSLNFFIYWVFNKSFRDTLKSKLSGLVRVSIKREYTISLEMNPRKVRESNKIQDPVGNEDGCETLELI